MELARGGDHVQLAEHLNGIEGEEGTSRNLLAFENEIVK
jgi:hypothetical protein